MHNFLLTTRFVSGFKLPKLCLGKSAQSWGYLAGDVILGNHHLYSVIRRKSLISVLKCSDILNNRKLS